MKQAVTVSVILFAGFFLWAGYKWGELDANYEHFRAVEKYKRYKCHDGLVYRRTLSGYWEDVRQACRNEEQIDGSR